MRGVSKVNSGFDFTIREMFGLRAGGRVRFKNDYEGRSQNRGEGLNMENTCLEADLMATRPLFSTRQTRKGINAALQSVPLSLYDKQSYCAFPFLSFPPILHPPFQDQWD